MRKSSLPQSSRKHRPILRPKSWVQRVSPRRLSPVASSFPLIAAHSINSSDALVLKSALAIAKKLRKAGDDLVLVASDQRLLRAVQAEGMVTFDPESLDDAALAALIGS